MAPPLAIKLRCASWQQLASIYKRDLSRNAVFLKSSNPPPLGTAVRIDLTLPSESMVVLTGTIIKHVGETEMEGRGPGVDVRLNAIPQSAMWLIETALASAQKETSKAMPAPRPAPPPREAAINDGADLAEAETELIVALTSELDSMKRLNPFQVLGLGYEATEPEIRNAFGELTKRYHPDRYARFRSSDLRNLAAEIFILIRDAYRRLGDEVGRSQVLAQLGRKVQIPPARPPTATPTPAPRRDPTPIPSATPVPARPPSTGPTGAARTGTPPPVRIPPAAPAPPPPDLTATPPTGEMRVGDASMAESMLDAGKYDEALAFYKILARRNPQDRQAKAGIELAEGLRALAMRDRLEAAQRFEAVLELDPANERAARELAEMRRQATNERKGMLSRLLGKKE